MHADPDLLALLAVGEHVEDDVRDHLATCPECAGELADLGHVVSLGREASSETLDQPAPDVWARIRVELGLRSDLDAEPDADSDAGLDAGLGTTPQPVGAEQAADPRAVATTLPPPATADAAARTELGPAEPDIRASGVATLQTDHFGRRILQLVLETDRPAAGLRQAWLVHRQDPGRRQNVGILDGAYGVWTIDQSIDLNAFGILEVSEQEPGENGYSGRSIVRGDLAAAA